MIQINSLSKSYGTQLLFDNASISLMAGERVGLVGRNGHGKSTLLRIIIGEEEPDSGQLKIPAGYKIGHLVQHLKFSEQSTLREVCQALPQSETLTDQTYRAKAVLQGLGFSTEQLELNPLQLSGGFQVRLNLAKLLVTEPNLLLLDEPTNYLDILSLRWLSRFLRAWKHELIMVTHDHAFMDSVTTHTLGIHRRKIRKLEGNTTKYYQQIEMDEAIYEQTRLNQERQIKESEDFINRFRAKASKASVVQSRVKALAKLKPLEKLSEINELKFRFNPHPFSGKWLLEGKELSFAYTPEQQPLIDGLTFALGKNDRIAVIGKNGQGKTTLLKLLTRELQPLTGDVSHSTNLKYAYFGQTNVDRLHPDWTVEEEISSSQPELSRTAVRNICGMMMFPGESAQKKITVLSGGEKSRVLLGKILVSPANCLFLDEPTNHLDQESTEAFVSGLETFPGGIIIVTHSEMILQRLATKLIVFDGGQTFLFEGGYDDFLSRVGWREEENIEDEDQTGSTLSKKELRRLRSQILINRAKATSKIRERMAEVEDRIDLLEKKVIEANETLIAASVNGFGENEAKLSRHLHRDKNEIDTLFDELEQLQKKLELISKEFDDKLEEILS